MNPELTRLNNIFSGKDISTEESASSECRIYYLEKKELAEIRERYPSKPYKKPSVYNYSRKKRKKSNGSDRND